MTKLISDKKILKLIATDDKVCYFEGSDRQWYWSFHSKNGKIIASGGEGFRSLSNCMRSFKNLVKNILKIKQNVEEGLQK